MDRLKFAGGILGLLVLGLWPGQTRAAEPAIRLIGPVGQVQVGAIFPVEIHLDSGGLNMNAAELSIQVHGEGTEITSIGRESSIFTLWPTAPTINGATAYLAGGRPGGIVAVNALVGTVSIVARQAGPVTISVVSSGGVLYRHDGTGTKVPVTGPPVEVQVADDLLPGLAISSTSHRAETDWGRAGEIQVDWAVQPQEQFSYRLSNDIGTVPDDDLELSAGPLNFSGLDDGIWYFVIKRRFPGEPWSPVYQRRFLLDRIPPEPFRLDQPDPSAVNGQAVLTWTAMDQTSGRVSYQGLVNGKKIGPVESPLKLRPEWRGQTIQIVAVDAAGNQRLSEPWRNGSGRWSVPWWAWFAVIIIGFGAAGVALKYIRRR